MNHNYEPPAPIQFYEEYMEFLLALEEVLVVGLSTGKRPIGVPKLGSKPEPISPKLLPNRPKCARSYCGRPADYDGFCSNGCALRRAPDMGVYCGRAPGVDPQCARPGCGSPDSEFGGFCCRECKARSEVQIVHRWGRSPEIVCGLHGASNPDCECRLTGTDRRIRRDIRRIDLKRAKEIIRTNQAERRKILFHRFLLWLAKHNLYTPMNCR